LEEEMNYQIARRAGRGLMIAVLASTTAACAGRSPTPVPVVQAQDRTMDCPAIIAESQANAKTLRELASEDGAKVAQNVAAGVAGIFIPVLWFGMDFQNASGKEATALQSRQQYLGILAEQKQCGATKALGVSATAAGE
jgi:hypothetical protein